MITHVMVDSVCAEILSVDAVNRGELKSSVESFLSNVHMGSSIQKHCS